MSVAAHKRAGGGLAPLEVAIVTVSDTRTEETDEGGRLIAELCTARGHQIRGRRIVRDDPDQVQAAVEALIAERVVQVVLITGGTGIARRDTTVEALVGRFDKVLDGFGELFRMLSFQEIGAAAMLSRAVAGTVGDTAVFVMPGSPAAVRLAMERLILPALGHVVSLLRPA